MWKWFQWCLWTGNHGTDVWVFHWQTVWPHKSQLKVTLSFYSCAHWLVLPVHQCSMVYLISVNGQWFLACLLLVPCFFLWQHWYRWEPSEWRASSCYGTATCDSKPRWPAGWPAQPGLGPSSQCPPGLLHADGCSGSSGRRPGQLGELDLFKIVFKL